MVIALPLWTGEAGGHYHNHPSLGKEALVLMITSISSFGQEEKPTMVSPSTLLAKKELVAMAHPPSLLGKEDVVTMTMSPFHLLENRRVWPKPSSCPSLFWEGLGGGHLHTCQPSGKGEEVVMPIPIPLLATKLLCSWPHQSLFWEGRGGGHGHSSLSLSLSLSSKRRW